MNPSKGDKVVVMLETNGSGDYRKAKKITQTVDAVYQDGRVRTSSGDVWRVRYNGTPGVFIALEGG